MAEHEADFVIYLFSGLFLDYYRPNEECGRNNKKEGRKVNNKKTLDVVKY